MELAIALAHGPRLLLMDEPTAGMAPAERVQLMQLVRRIARERRMGVLFTEHSMDVVFGQADRVAVLVRGQLLVFHTRHGHAGDDRRRRLHASYLSPWGPRMRQARHRAWPGPRLKLAWFLPST